jgi:hypothetical protein
VGRNSAPGRESPQGPDHAIARIAARQHGNISRAQLRTLGLSDDAVAHRSAAGRLHRVHRGVYAVGRHPVTPLERAAAAVLACGEHAALAHTSALTLWGLRKEWDAPLHVAVTQGDRRPTGITVHRCTTLARRDLTVQRGIRVTSPVRTLLECAPALSDRALTRAVNDARIARLTRPAQLAELLSRNAKHPGAKRLAAVAGRGAQGPTRSDFENGFAAFCARYGLPAPAFNVVVGGYEVDAYFESARLIVELDSWEFHQDRAAFERDRERDADHLAAGLRTARITWERLVKSPAKEARRLAAILQRG